MTAGCTASHSVRDAKVGTSSDDESPNALYDGDIQDLSETQRGRRSLTTALSDLFGMLWVVCLTAAGHCHGLCVRSRDAQAGRLLCYRGSAGR